ncbi:MAG: hypothetical protein ACI9Y7_002433 [Dokdonia sp.]|jgi:hypothetical protein
MKLLLSILVFGFLAISCSNSKNNKEENPFVKIDGWDVIVEKGITDTLYLDIGDSKPELYVKFINTSEPTCLIPYLNFYPIELEEYIKKILRYRLILRANPFPPAPNTYTTDKYYIVGWNLVSYNDLKCCDCKNLES